MVILLKHNKLRKHQVNLKQKQFNIKRVLAPTVPKISINWNFKNLVTN